MSSPFAARRKAKVIGRDDETPESTTSGTDSNDQEPLVKRPASKAKKRTSMRVSFGPGGVSMAEDDSTSEIFTPKKSNLSRQATEKNALRKSVLAASLARESMPTRHNELRPSYSKEDLAELRSSTPSTPRPRTPTLSDTAETPALDLAAKFGTDLAKYDPSNGNPAIPTHAEIQEKKARRARLAKEQRYRRDSDSGESGQDDDLRPEGHDSDEDEFRNQHDTISLGASNAKQPDTRLIPDDEDMMEDFDSFVDDGRITLGRKAERAQKDRRKAEMRELIEDAEGSSSDGSDDSEKERRDEYEAAQTRKGMEGLRVGARGRDEDERARTPPRITPLPTLAACQERLREMLLGLEASLAQKVNQLEDIEEEKKEIAITETEIQRLLDETGEQYKQLLADGAVEANGLDDGLTPHSSNTFGAHRGLESMGGTPVKVANGATE